MKLLPILMTLIVTSFAQPANSKPARQPQAVPSLGRQDQRMPDWQDVYRHRQGWHSVIRESGRKTRAVTGIEGRGRATVIVVEYNRDGSVRRSERMELSR